jgi:hypothetical protein
VEELRRRIRLAYVEGAEERSLMVEGRPLTREELKGVLDRFAVVPSNRFSWRDVGERATGAPLTVRSHRLLPPARPLQDSRERAGSLPQAAGCQ